MSCQACRRLIIWFQEPESRSKFSQSGADCFRAAETSTVLLNDSTKFISVLGMGEEDNLRWEKLCRPCERAEKCDSYRASSVPEAPFCIRKRGFTHPGAPVLQQPAPWSGVRGGHRERGHGHPSVRRYGPYCRLRSVLGHDSTGHPGRLQVQRSALDVGQSFQHLLPRQWVHPQRAHPWPGECEAVAEGERPAAAKRLHLRHDFLHPLSHQLHQRLHHPGGGGSHSDWDP